MRSPEEIKPVSSKLRLEFRNVDINTVFQAVDFRAQKTADAFLKFLHDGDLGIYAYVDGKVVGHAWAVLNENQPSKRIDGYMDIKQNEAFIHYCNVSETYRGNNIYPRMLSLLCKQLFDQKKVQKIIIDSEVTNQASLNGIKKVGFKFLTNKMFIQLFNKSL